MSTSTLKRVDPTQVELEIAIPADDLERARERAFREISKNAKIAGFRPGKVPRKIFEANYGTQAIEERARDAVLNAAYQKALEDNALEPVAQAKVEELPPPDDAPADVRFLAKVSIRPDFTLGEYTGLVVTFPPSAVADADGRRDVSGPRDREAGAGSRRADRAQGRVQPGVAHVPSDPSARRPSTLKARLPEGGGRASGLATATGHEGLLARRGLGGGDDQAGLHDLWQARELGGADSDPLPAVR